MSVKALKKIMYLGVLCFSGRKKQLTLIKEMRRHQYDSAEETELEHQVRLGEILRFACLHVPYYRGLFEARHLSVNDLIANPTEMLASLPLLDKSILRANLADLKSDDLAKRQWHYNTSGGSTGEPVRFVQDAAYHHAGLAGKYLFDEWSGHQLGGSKVVLWGSERDLLVGRKTWRSRMGFWIRSECPLNTFRMSDVDMRNFVETINRARPIQLLAYAESAYQLARFIEREQLSVYAPNAVMTSAGTLYPYMRETIERVFRAPVFNRYGSREVGDVACECEFHKGLHVNPYTHHVEILREDGSPCVPGEVGEVVISLLTNKAMPLLRYRIGDMAAWAEQSCNCGRSWRLLQEIQGRVTDNFITRGGGLVHGEYFTHLLYFKDWCQKFQFIQEEYDFIRLLVIPVLKETQMREIREIVESGRRELENNIQQAMGAECKLQIELVDDIPPSPSGKHRYTVSKVWNSK